MAKTDNLSVIFSGNLRRLIAKKGIKQKELSNYLQVSPATISNWLAGQKLPRMGKLDKLCKFFDVERSALLEYQNFETDIKSTPLNVEESKLVNDYRALSGINKQMITNLITTFLNAQDSAATKMNDVVQNNNSGNNIYANGGGNSYNFVATR